MPFRSCDILQFEELKILLASSAGSAAGKDALLAIEPQRERVLIEAALAEAGEAIDYLRATTQPQPAARGAVVRLRFGSLREIRDSLRILKVEGARLEGSEILDLLHTLEQAGEFRGLILSVAAKFPRLARRAERLADLRPIAHQYRKAFLPDGSLADDASVALRRIRRDIEKQQKQIQHSLEKFLRLHHSDGTLQEEFVTIRDDRYVVPIISGQKRRVDGVIHGSSGSGRTLFVEPLETIALNNQLVQLREDEIWEIERILSEITDALRAHAEEIASTAETLTALDVIFAKAGFAQDYSCVVPRFSPDANRRLLLREARHPLLEEVLRKQERPIVPISFEVNERQRCLLISGPNTGGKTVTLKTAGLLALMAHAALPVPAMEAEFPLLDDVLADIGDAQSITESLSSFSGHLVHVKEMLASATSESLVLLDELGRATDPEEGGALGVAILDSFRQAGTFCLASTHLLPLKIYGAKTDGVLNASMGFDEETLQPTYQLRVGAPGKSAGLDIASRLAMPPEVITKARSVLSSAEVDLQALLVKLHRQLEENRRRATELDSGKAALENRAAELEREAVKREQQRQREWEARAEELLAQFDEQARSTIDRVVNAAEQRKAAEQAARAVAKTKREFRELAAETMPVTSQAAAVTKLVVKEGARVRLKDIRDAATVRKILKNGMIEVEAGFLKMQVSPEDVVEVVGSGEGPALPRNVSVQTGPRWDVSYREINVIGQHAEEAIEQVDKFLDSAALASINRVRIVHGHGMGILKRAIGELLERNPHVSRFYSATPTEGGTGATIAELRE